MIALQIEDIKVFMNKLFKDTTFDEFEVVSMDITQQVHFSIDGMLQVLPPEPDEAPPILEQKYIAWTDLKPTVFPLIKGSKTPSTLKIIFAISHKNKLNILQKSNAPLTADDIHGFILTLLYENTALKVYTGTNYKTFTLDKSLEKYFDESMIRFFTRHEIPFSNLND